MFFNKILIAITLSACSATNQKNSDKKTAKKTIPKERFYDRFER